MLEASGQLERTKRRYQTMVKIVRYQGKRKVTITIHDNGDVTVTVEPPTRKRQLDNLLLFKQRNR
jgi:hypothetical protein